MPGNIVRKNIVLSTFPPHNILAEELFIGITLLNLNKNTINEISNQVNYNALVLEAHQIIYRIILACSSRSELDVIKLTQYLSEKRLLHKIGGLERILDLINQTTLFQKLSNNKLSLSYYIEVIQNKYIRRLIIQWSTYIISLCATESIDLNLVLKQANKYIEKIVLQQKQNNSYSVSTIIKDLINDLDVVHKTNHKFNLLAIRSGLRPLDKVTEGFQPSDLIIIAGRPAMGKTSIALNIINYMLHDTNQGVILFSLEMSKKQVLYRLLSMQCKLTISKIRKGSLTTIDLRRIKKSCQSIAQTFFYIDDNPNTTVFELSLKAKEITKKYITGLIVIDYLQLVQDSGLYFNNRVQELSSITRILKILAREISIPLIVLSQLNRNVEGRTNKRPLLSDLRESGCIKTATKLVHDQLLLQINQITICYVYFASSTCTHNNKLSTINAFGKKFFKNLQYTYNLHFSCNTQIFITNNHNLLTFRGWVAEENLLLSDTIIIKHNNLYIKLLNNLIYFYAALTNIQWHTYILTYDIRISKLVNFQTNKTIIHNSIEQDADLVLLLYREDYYNPNQDTKKLTEVIIAKHRNGPTGSFELYFDPSYTIFTSY
uniref:Replicative DNA helicase n=1 Tax=Hildenbrandia rivularis TaxID=135206 RepID=A0A1C9CFM0_9FLOR|nr:replication helicase subunit [Hildenbrandia rivularis]AOM67183.1 replication helicase subunit [Hildenbrandia rivularis]